MKCQRCHQNKARFKVKNKLNRKTENICEYCEESGDDIIEIINDERNESGNINNQELNENKINEDAEFGRLHRVKRTLKEFNCRECKNIIPKGSECFNQAIHTYPFPTPSKICLNCGKLQIQKGVEVVEKK